MIDVRRRLKGATDRKRWATRRASFVAKLKATKAVWLPGTPEETGKMAAAAASKTTGASKKAAKKAPGASKKAAKKTPGASKKAAKKAPGASKKAAKKSTDG